LKNTKTPHFFPAIPTQQWIKKPNKITCKKYTRFFLVLSMSNINISDDKVHNFVVNIVDLNCCFVYYTYKYNQSNRNYSAILAICRVASNAFWDSKPELFSDIACLRIPYQPCLVLFGNIFFRYPRLEPAWITPAPQCRANQRWSIQK
jgi:hypothetical protein